MNNNKAILKKQKGFAWAEFICFKNILDMLRSLRKKANTGLYLLVDALQGRKLQNQGANLGAINMAAGKQAALTFDNQGLIGISVTKETLHDELGEMPLSNTHMRIAA